MIFYELYYGVRSWFISQENQIGYVKGRESVA